MFGWGVSDFFANLSSDKIGHFKTFFWSQVAGLITVLTVFLVFKSPIILSPKLVLMIITAGISYTLGYLFFYKGFELGNVSIISAVINSQNLFIVLIAFLVYGQRLTVLQIPALVSVLIGILLVSVDFNEIKKGGLILTKGVKETLLASIFFGVIYWPFNEFISEQIDWRQSTLLIKIVAVLFVVVFAAFRKEKLSLSKKIENKFLLFVILTGVLEAVGVLGTSFGLAFGDSVIVGPISSALTLVTVSLAVIFLKEKLTRLQILGIVMTVGGIVLSAF